jgi:glyoxylase-like metal-dependent hydrolase (beta-lactamase superfamily II)
VSETIAAYARGTLAEQRVCGALPQGAGSRDYALPTWHATHDVMDGERLDLGGRTLEVLRTPGHTPDSICLLDRENGLLFTGDTYYSGEIYLWSPETHLADYIASIGRLASLAARLKKLLPAHGPPVAEPRRLPELRSALAEIQAGSVPPELTPEGRRLFQFEEFSLLMSGSTRTE